MKPNTIWIHCSATRPGWMQGAHVADKVAEIRRWHKDRGWRDIGYHWVIDRDGSVAPGRPETMQGAHVAGHNEDSIGICLLGGHGSARTDAFSDHYTPDQNDALRNLLREIEGRHGPQRVRGHNEVAAKACPGFDVQRALKKKPVIRTNPTQSTTLRAAAAGLGGTLGAVASVFTAIGQLAPLAQAVLILGATVAVAAFAYIARERLRKWAAGDR